MTIKLVELAHEVRILELEVRKLELENRIAHLKPEQLIDEGCVGCAGPCNVVDVAANLQKELDDAHGILASKDRVLVNLHKTIHDFKAIETQETDRLHKIIEDLKDRNIADLKELYDFHEGELEWFKDELSACKEDKTTVFEVEYPVDGSRTIHLQKMRIDEQSETISRLIEEVKELRAKEITVTYAFLELP